MTHQDYRTRSGATPFLQKLLPNPTLIIFTSSTVIPHSLFCSTPIQFLILQYPNPNHYRTPSPKSYSTSYSSSHRTPTSPSTVSPLAFRFCRCLSPPGSACSGRGRMPCSHIRSVILHSSRPEDHRELRGYCIRIRVSVFRYLGLL